MQFYLKSRLNCLLLSKEWDTVSKEQEPSNTESTQQSKESSNEGLEMDEESDAIWDSMETVNTKTAKNDIPPKTGKETDIIETTAGFKRTKSKKTDLEIEPRKKLKQTKEKRQDKAENRKHKKRSKMRILLLRINQLVYFKETVLIYVAVGNVLKTCLFLGYLFFNFF